MSHVAITLQGSIDNPLLVATCPIKGTSVILTYLVSIEFDTLLMTATQKCSQVLIMIFTGFLNCVTLGPVATKSSATTSTPQRPSTISCILHWNTSGAEYMPNGIRVHRYHPNSVWKVVSSEDCSSRETCQNPLRT